MALTLIIIFASLLALTLLVLLLVFILPPKEEAHLLQEAEPQQTSDSSWRLGESWFRKSRSGLWELYVSGKPFERGLAAGKLTRDLMYRQESIFISEIAKIVPSKAYISFLKVLVALMNRRLDKHIGDEYCREIHGVSWSAPKEFNRIGPRYQRMLNYHAAHDIGHTLQSLHLVKCTAFSVWGNRSHNGEIFTGRNFDFYVGDEFSKEKIVCFFDPEQGYRFAGITWGGMIGCVSGMNEHGLAVTVNGAKSEFPNRSATPVSILVREILQYARNISEAWSITEKKKIFVSESLIISSAEDHKTVVFEKSRSRTVLYESQQEQLICTNHFQSPELFNDRSNQKYIAESPSKYRYQRVEELLAEHERISEREIAAILRDKRGLNNEDIGMGNEKAVDQLLAHHSVIFNPDSRKMWISCGPYPEGAYQCYDLSKIFNNGARSNETIEQCDLSREIPKDPFLNSNDHQRFIKYKQGLALFGSKINKNLDLDSQVDEFIASNPEMFAVYSALGDHYLWKKKYSTAARYYQTGLKKHIPNKNEADHMLHNLNKCKPS